MGDKDVAIWQATEAFVGDGMTIQPGDTVTAGHPILKGRAIFFQPFVPMYDHKRDKAARDEALAEQLEAEAKAEADAKAAADEAVSYADLQAEAKALGIPATGKREELQSAVDEAKAAAASEAEAARVAAEEAAEAARVAAEEAAKAEAAQQGGAS
jgi:hypothetical protein